MTTASKPDAPPVPLEVQLACVRREIEQRKRVYPRLIANKRMSEAKADHEIAAMRAVEATLNGLVEAAAASRTRS